MLCKCHIPLYVSGIMMRGRKRKFFANATFPFMFQVSWWLGNPTPSDEFYSKAKVAILGFAALVTVIGYASGRAGTVEGGEHNSGSCSNFGANAKIGTQSDRAD
jgi:hypothetical protein